ncbi:hypothetical protein SFRURICE_006918 [Spodoptera frugiperda]|uniref:SFRICE_025142 n=1 Tax=Spodoptera frugiperda TaxID=7108 RepID=A0A2H1VPJ5_SPOFR|nr:uncharacterized protein LOC118268256 [Spodoptera frugiperda]KAF9797043.1 hypothetical protein SFRURICE_006918 [Spodoptera frugiperda]
MAKLPCSLASVLLVVIAIHVSSNTVSTSNTFKYQMPDACAGKAYCFEKGDHYPDEAIQKLNLSFATQSIIGSRQGSDVDEPDCPADSKDGPIYYVVDENGAVRVVVQIPDRFSQNFNVRWCQNEGKLTNDTRHFMASRIFNRFDVECVNVKSKFNVVVLSQEEDKIEIVRANIPVCCKCRYDLKSL